MSSVEAVIFADEMAQLEGSTVPQTVPSDKSASNHDVAILSIEDVAQLTGWSKRTVYRFFEKRKQHIITKTINGWEKYYISASALPAKFRPALGPVNNPAEAASKEIAENRRMSAWEDYARQYAERARSTIREWALYIYKCKGRPAGGKTKAMIAWCREREISAPTLRRWIKNYDENGIDGLAPGWGNQAGAFRALRAEDAAYVEAIYLCADRPTVTKAAAAEAYANKCKGLGIEPACESTIRKYLSRKSIDDKKQALIMGEAAFVTSYGARIIRAWSCFDPGEIYVGDHRQLDEPCVWDNGKILFPWLTAWYDAKSKSLVGWNLCEKPNSDSIKIALTRAFRDYGAPRCIITDNGKDYRAKVFTGDGRIVRRKYHYALEDYQNFQTSLYARLGLEVIFAVPYNARAKIIENFFVFLAMRHDKCLPGYRGTNSETRPYRADELIEEAKKRIAAGLKPESGKIMGKRELIDELTGWIAWYHQRPSGSKDIPGQSPNQVWESNRQVHLRRMPVNTLEFLMMKEQDKTVRPGGFVNLTIEGRKLTYYADVLLQHWVGCQVHLRYHPDDLSSIHVLDPKNGGLVCSAGLEYAPPGITRDEQLKESVLKEQGRRMKLLKRQIRDGQDAREKLQETIMGYEYQGRPDPSTIPPGPDLSQHPIEIMHTGTDAVARAAALSKRAVGADPFSLDFNAPEITDGKHPSWESLIDE